MPPTIAIRTLATARLAPARFAALAACLTPAEHVRADRFAHPHDRRDWIAARALLRHLVAAHLGLPAAAIRLDAEPGGKPFLPQAATPRPDISVTHTTGFVACALARTGRVGIDAEYLCRAPPPEAAALLSAAEAAWLRARPAATRAHDFLRLWTLKEALAKAEGSGLRLDFTTFTVLPDPPCLTAAPPCLAAAHLSQWRHAGRYIVALAHLPPSNSAPCATPARLAMADIHKRLPAATP